MRRGVRDPRLKEHLIGRLLQVEANIRAMGYTPEEVKTNQLSYGPPEKKVEASVPLPSWTTSEEPNQDRDSDERKVRDGTNPTPPKKEQAKEQPLPFHGTADRWSPPYSCRCDACVWGAKDRAKKVAERYNQ